MKRYLLTLSLSILMFSNATSQKVENIQARAEKNSVIITYDLLASNPDQKFTIELRSSIDNYATPLKKVSGDVGPDQSPGFGKKIVWAAITEQGNFSGSVTFEITATLTFSPLTILKPTAGTKAKIGKPLDVKWQGGSKDRALKMAILQGGKTITEIPSVGNSGTYSWMVPKSTPKGANYKIKLFDPTKPNDSAMSAEFQLKKTSILVYVIPGVVVAGAAAYFLLGGDNGGGDTPPPVQEDPLPTPPDLPTGG